METVSTELEAPREPSERALRFLAYQRESLNFGTGGRIVALPTEEELAQIPAQDIQNAREYYFANIRNLGLPLFEPPLP